jgi:integrase
VHAVAAYTALRPGELRVLTWADVDLAARLVHAKAWDYAEERVKVPKTANGVRRVPIDPHLVPLLERMQRGKARAALVVPCMSAVVDNTLAEIFRAHLTAASVARPELTTESRTHAISNFRSWRDSGLTWLAMTGLGVDKIMRRAGHDQIQTTWAT